MSRWIKKVVPPFSERLIGFSIPDEGRILIGAYDGVHVITLGDNIEVLRSVDADFDELAYERGIVFEDKHYDLMGLITGKPILENPAGESLTIDPVSEVLSVAVGIETQFEMKYEKFSGDWAAATFSRDGNWIALGCPYDFDFVILQRQVCTH